MLMLLNWNKHKFDDLLACLFTCLLFNILAYGNAYAYKTYKYVWKTASGRAQLHQTTFLPAFGCPSYMIFPVVKNVNLVVLLESII